MKYIFIDFETMGQNVHDCAAIDCAAICVTTEKMLSSDPYNLRDIVNVSKFKLSIKDQVENYKSKVYEDTVKFWSTVSEEARKHIKPLKTDLTVENFVEDFLKYLIDCGKIDYWWSRSNTFDPVLLARIFDSANKYNHMNAYLPHWKIRDIRTFIDVKLDFPKKNGFVPIQDEEKWKKVFVEHNSSWDVLADVLRMQAILRAENDLEQV
jgi:hypothetical protein